MAVNKNIYHELNSSFSQKNITLVAVSKTKPVSDILELYDLGHRDFGENYVQELVAKQKQLPADIRWHFIGHLQRNKVKDIAPFVHLIHSIDSLRLLTEVNRQAFKCGKTIAVLLQVHIAREETKFGLDEAELKEIISSLPALANVMVKGLMGMASLTHDREVVRAEFHYLSSLYDRFSLSPGSRQGSGTADVLQAAARLPLTTLSMGMSSDYPIAIEEGSTMVRIGSLLFGSRN